MDEAFSINMKLFNILRLRFERPLTFPERKGTFIHGFNVSKDVMRAIRFRDDTVRMPCEFTSVKLNLNFERSILRALIVFNLPTVGT